MAKRTAQRKKPPSRKKQKTNPTQSQQPWVPDHVAAASLAYKDDHVSDINQEIQLGSGWEYLKSIDGASGCRVKIWVSKTNGNILCGFRGTQSIAEAKIDADIGFAGFKTQGGEDKGNIHRGFERGFADIRNQLDDELRMMRDFGYMKEGASLQFAGHSLGGALSDIASTYYAGMFPEAQVITTTLGAPMTGDKAFAEYSKSLPNLHRTRIVSDSDPVARTPIPGMQHIEKNNVLDFRTRKDSKSTLTRILEAGKEIVAGGSAGVQLSTTGKDILDQHGLDYYTKVLSTDFRENQVYNPNELVERDIQMNETNYQRSKDSKEPVQSGTCKCDCHYHDLANEKGDPPPQSTGAVEQMQPANTENMETSDNLQLNDTQNTFKESVQQSTNMTDLLEKQKTQQAYAQATAEEIVNQLNTALDAQKEKEKTELQKLQDRYAALTNQTDEDLDDISKERQTFQKDQDDIQYFESRIQYELDHPEYVKEDGYDSKNKAVSFKNRMNKLYTLILSTSDQRKIAIDTGQEKPLDQDDIDRNTSIDQAEQQQGAENNKNLNPDDQAGPWVFDVTKLPDLDTKDAPQSVKQIREWLGYPDMTAKELYETLKTNMTQEYREERMGFLRQKEQDTRKSAAEKIKTQLDNYSNATGTGTYDKLNQARQAFFKDLGGNPRFQQLVRENKVDMKAIASKYQKAGDETSIMTDLLGYDPKTSKDALQQEYQKQLMDLPNDIDASERARIMQDSWKQYNLHRQYPWVKSDKFKETYDKYAGDPKELSNQLNALRPTLPSSYATDPDMVINETGFNAKLMQQNVETLANNSKEIVQQDMVDYYQQFRDRQLADFADAGKVNQMFKQWNPEKSIFEKAGEGIKDIMTLGTTRQGGWYNKDGQYLGATASPDFEAYVRDNPDSGFKYIPTQVDSTAEFLWDNVGEALGMRYGINPMAGIDKMAGGTKDTNNDGVVDSKDWDDEGDDNEIFNPYAFMGAAGMGGDGDNDGKPSKSSKSSKKDKPRRGNRTRRR